MAKSGLEWITHWPNKEEKLLDNICSKQQRISILFFMKRIGASNEQKILHSLFMKTKALLLFSIASGTSDKAEVRLMWPRISHFRS